MALLLILSIGGTMEMNAQSWLEQLGKKVEETAKKKVEEKAQEKTSKVIDDVLDGKLGKKKKGKDKDKSAEDAAFAAQQQAAALAAQQAAQQAAAQQAAGQTAQTPAVAAAPQIPQAPAMNWNKFDFVSGDEVIFDDQLANEKIGEFPSQWDLGDGYAEIAEINGMKVIYGTKDTHIMPFMKEKHYLPDVFTIEFDIYIPQGKRDNGYMVGPEIGGNSRYDIDLVGENDRNVFNLYWYNHYWEIQETDVRWEWLSGGEIKTGNINYAFKYDDFNRVSISFNQRALKVYLNETRVANIPRCDAPKSFNIYFYQGEKEYRFIKDIRIAKGAVPLYDRMMSEGNFITYGITFDVGKATIKPESMGEINRIVQLMNENPTLKFSVEGHTDSTGNATSNQTLSEQRSQAIVAKLVELGIAADRLTAVGKGQNSPIADNSTDEGRAKNRRVEFVKL